MARIQEVSATLPPKEEVIWKTSDSSAKKRSLIMYRQITSGERYALGALHTQGLSQAEIGRQLGRHRSTIGRELKRNRTRYDGAYRPSRANERTNGRRSRSRRNRQFGPAQYELLESLLRRQWSPEQVSGYLRRERLLEISYETIYLHVWRDKVEGGLLWKHLRCSLKHRRKRYRTYGSRGRLAGKKLISERPAAVEARKQIGHWEMDTVIGHASKDCILSLVERVSGYSLVGKLRDRTKESTTARAIELIRRHGKLFKSITADNGTEFHDYKTIEAATGVPIHFATPYHSWGEGPTKTPTG